MTDRPNDRVDDAVAQFLRYLEDGVTRPSLYGLNDTEQREAEAIFRLLETCWGADIPAAPPLEEDPIAIELGLVPAQPTTVTISGRSVKRLRQERSLQLQQVTDALAERGHRLTLQAALQMEQSTATEVDRALAVDLARLLGASLEQLTASSSASSREGFAWYFGTRRFAEQIARWARSHNRDVMVERTRIEHTLATAPRRSRGRLSEDECARLVDAYLRSITP